MSERLALAAAFVAALHAASRRNPRPGAATKAIGRAAGISDPGQLELAVRDAEVAGLVESWADGSHVRLTPKGRGATTD